MLLANQFAGSTLFECGIDASGANASAYAANTRAGIRVALFNKNATRDLLVRIPWKHSISQAPVSWLTAGALDATAGVTLAGTEIGADASWHPEEEETLKLERNHFLLKLPRASAALVSILG